jgi:hypothetical protein
MLSQCQCLARMASGELVNSIAHQRDVRRGAKHRREQGLGLRCRPGGERQRAASGEQHAECGARIGLEWMRRRAHHEQARGARPVHERDQQRKRGIVDIVDVVDRNHEGMGLAHATQPLGQRGLESGRIFAQRCERSQMRAHWRAQGARVWHAEQRARQIGCSGAGERLIGQALEQLQRQLARAGEGSSAGRSARRAQHRGAGQLGFDHTRIEQSGATQTRSPLHQESVAGAL